MSYYIFKPAVDTPETGSQYPQVQKMSPGYDYKAPNSVHALSKAYNHFPEYAPNFDYFVVHSKAKLTDLLSLAVLRGGFLISDKLKTVFEKFNICQHKYYQVRLSHRDNFYDNYYWMHMICDLTRFVDYGKSKFFIYLNYAHNLGTIDTTSFDDLTQKEKKLQADNPGKTLVIWGEKIKLNNSFDKSLDLFKISSFDNNYYVSEKLKDELISRKITGCNIYTADNLIA